jgi:hypothetical protein
MSDPKQKDERLRFKEGTPVPDEEVLFNPNPSAAYGKDSQDRMAALRDRLLKNERSRKPEYDHALSKPPSGTS